MNEECLEILERCLQFCKKISLNYQSYRVVEKRLNGNPNREMLVVIVAVGLLFGHSQQPAKIRPILSELLKKEFYTLQQFIQRINPQKTIFLSYTKVVYRKDPVPTGESDDPPDKKERVRVNPDQEEKLKQFAREKINGILTEVPLDAIASIIHTYIIKEPALQTLKNQLNKKVAEIKEEQQNGNTN